jgi:hypothetical protein
MFRSVSIGELIITQGVAADDDVDNCRRYLAEKWGLQEPAAEEVSGGFEQIAAYLADTDIPTIWEAATEDERRVLVDELLDGIEVHADHLLVIVRGGAPAERRPGRGRPQVRG